jgi:hypothetical protein
MNRKLFILIGFCFVVFVFPVNAQATVQCGSIVEGEFTKSGEAQNYLINLWITEIDYASSKQSGWNIFFKKVGGKRRFIEIGFELVD